MAKLKLSEVRDLVAFYLMGDDSTIYVNAINRNKDKSIGIFSAPESRASKTLTYGGDDHAPVKKFPVNILVHWTEDSSVCEDRANEVYDTIKNLGQNFPVRSNDLNATIIAFARLLDEQPIWIGRDDSNVCEYSIRVDFYYYHKE